MISRFQIKRVDMSSPEPFQFQESQLPETPHEVLIDRGIVDAVIDLARAGEKINLLDSLLQAVDWTQFVPEGGAELDDVQLAGLKDYYRRKWSDIGPLYLAELLSTEFMTEQRARGDIAFSDRLIELGRTEPELWQEIRQFFRRKEMVTGLLVAAHDPLSAANAGATSSDDEEDLWE
jgi:hypothetical protein